MTRGWDELHRWARHWLREPGRRVRALGLRGRVIGLVVAALLAGGAVVLAGSVLTLGLVMKWKTDASIDTIRDTTRDLAIIELVVLGIVLACAVYVADRLVAREIAQRVRVEAQLRQFVADASHELRTPVAVIRGHAEFAMRDGEGGAETAVAAVRRIHAETLRMGTLVENLLLLSRMDVHQVTHQDEDDADLSLAVLEAVDAARHVAPAHRWELDLPAEPVAVRGDEDALRRAVGNLISNAARHTPPGTLVGVALKETPEAVQVVVSDDGPGIAPALLPHIFERFVRGDDARSRASGSTGLGLAIVHAIVHSHGGTVTVTSRPGRTVFTVRLPHENRHERRPGLADHARL